MFAERQWAANTKTLQAELPDLWLIPAVGGLRWIASENVDGEGGCGDSRDGQFG